MTYAIGGLGFVEEAGLDGGSSGFLPWNVTSDEPFREWRREDQDRGPTGAQ